MIKQILIIITMLFCFIASAQTYVGTITQASPVYIPINNGNGNNITLIGGTASNIAVLGASTNSGNLLISGGNALTLKDAGGNTRFSVDGATGNTVVNGTVTATNLNAQFVAKTNQVWCVGFTKLDGASSVLVSNGFSSASINNQHIFILPSSLSGVY